MIGFERQNTALLRGVDQAFLARRYAAKLDSEGAAMYDAAKALKQAMIELGLACDGGKDSLSMAANVAGEVCRSMEPTKSKGHVN